MALTTVQVHGEFLAPVTNVPAVGTVTFNTMIELRDVVDNIVYTPMTFTATLDLNGEFTIVVPATDNPDLVPNNWVYQVWINTDILNTVQYFQIPFSVGTTEFADLEPLDFDPCVNEVPLSTPIAPSDYDLFVRRAGDTMTGNLILAGGANLTVTGAVGITGLLTGNIASIGTISGSSLNYTTGVFTGSLSVNFDGDTLNVGQLLAMGLSTSVISGGELTPNANPALIDISAMTGYIVDYNSSAVLSPTNPMITFVSTPAQIGVLPLFPVTRYSFDSTGTLMQLGTPITAVQRRQQIFLGATVTTLGVIVIDQTLPVIPSQLGNQLVDLIEDLGGFSIFGNLISANGVNLSINKTAGSVFIRAFNQIPNYLDPHQSALAVQTPVNFRHITAVPGGAGLVVTLLNVGFYDPGGLGVVTPVGGGANTSTNFRVWGSANNTVNEQVFIQYGQNTYANLATATSAIGSGAYIPNPATVEGAALLGWISVTRTATDLSNPLQATFTKASRFATP